MDLQKETARLAQLIEDRLDIRGPDFATKVRRAGRLLPRHVRKDASLLAASLPMAGHPRLSRQLEEDRLARAAKHLETHLLSVDPWERRMDRFVSWAAGLAFGLLLFAGVCLWAVWVLGYL